VTAAEGGHVSITVADDGAGVPPEMGARLFEPYATTKAHGTGLGLAIAQRIALEHNGELAYLGPSDEGVAIDSKGESAGVPLARRPMNGKRTGARFRVVLPLAGPPPSTETTPTPND
jgi:signal transduction histidine kinase